MSGKNSFLLSSKQSTSSELVYQQFILMQENILTENCAKRFAFGKVNEAATTLIYHFEKVSLSANDASPNKEVPMDIDSSGNLSTNSLNEFEQHTATEDFKELQQSCIMQIPIKAITDEKSVPNQFVPKQFSYCSVLLFLAIMFLVSAVILVTNDNLIHFDQEAQLNNIRHDLDLLLDQPNVVNIIIETFEHMYSWPTPIKVLPFIGSSGVGKTFTANIIKRNFISSVVFEITAYHLANISKQKEILGSLKGPFLNLVIIEGLSAADSSRVIDFIAHIPETTSILIIPIYNTQHTLDGWNYTVHDEDYDLIRNAYDKSGFDYQLVSFNVLRVETVEKWLRKELHRLNIDKDKHSKLVKSLIDIEQVERKGFKGINAKLLLALNKI